MAISITKMNPAVPIKNKKSENQEPIWITQKTVARKIGRSNAWVSTMTNREIDPIPHRRLCGALQYDMNHVNEWVERNSKYTGM